MERIQAEEEGLLHGILGAIRPPRPEDAGLEDCALPPESIIEAFSRAATSLKSRVDSSFSSSVHGEGGGCVQDPAPSNDQIPDKLLGIGEIIPSAWPLCADGGNKEAEREGDKDEVVVVGAGGVELDTDRVLVLGGGGDVGEGKESDFGGKSGCIVDGEVLPGVKNGDGFDGDLDEDDEDKDGAVLVEGIL